MKLEKIEKVLGKEVMSEIEAMSSEQLSIVIVSAEQAMSAAKDELETNPKYQDLKENLKAISLSKRDVDKFQKAKIALALNVLRDQGK